MQPGNERLNQNGDVIRRVRTVMHQQQLLPGEKIGTERALSEQLHVTRTALRSALAQMEQNHEIIRRIGKHGGIIVSDGRLTRNIDTIEGLPDIARRQGFKLESRLLNASLSIASNSDIRHLNLTGDNTIFRISRLRFLDDVPFSIEQSSLPASMFPQLLSHEEFPQSLYGTLNKYYDVKIVSSNETLEIIEAQFEQAALLNLPEGTPLVRILRIASDEQGRVVERGVDIFVAAKIRFTLHPTGYVRLSAVG